ncbi:MAG TPA: POTRA domain-containing protein [Ignavibacteriaceae bacterium]|nr:POTRA domain-containing protein [Ignavibacteriaceae bacterium]
MIIKFVFVFSLISSFVFANYDDSTFTYVSLPAIVDSIYIYGDSDTDTDIIERELTISIGDLVDSSHIYYDRERVFSLGIFTRVQFSVIRIDEKNTLRIYIEDGWNIWPIPFAYFQDNDWGRFSFGLDLLFNNFRGRNEKFRIKGGAGFDPSILFSYSVPDFVRSEEISLDVNVEYKSVTNRSVQAELYNGGVFDQKFFGTSLMIGNREDLFYKYSAYVGFLYIATPFFNPQISFHGDRIDRFGYSGIRFTYDTRDLIQYPSKGVSLFVDVQYKGIGNDAIDYSVFMFDFRNYESMIYGLTSKWRLATRQVIGSRIPFYDNSIIGFGERIRGHYNERKEGRSLYVGSFEIRHPIIDNFDVSFDLPLLPKELTTYRLELHTQVFADAGIIQKDNQKMMLKDLSKGFGFGFTVLILPYNIARAEIAFNEKLSPELILELGISF